MNKDFCILISDQAELDINLALEYLLKVSDKATSKKFLLEVKSVLEIISKNPNIGSSRFSYLISNKNIRHFIINNYKYFLFYNIEKNNIRIIRLLHTSRDIKSVLFI